MASSILIVEDDLVFSTMMKTWLTKKGFQVDTASANTRARKLLAEHTYDLILSDLRLPDQDGIHLLTWLREQSCHTPFIIMTSYAEIQSAVQAMKHGASDYIAKPIHPDELLNKIKENIGKPEIPAADLQEKNIYTLHAKLSGRRKRSRAPTVQLCAAGSPHPNVGADYRFERNRKRVCSPPHP